MDITDAEVDSRFCEQVYKHPWYEAAPAGDGGKPSMLAAPGVLLTFFAGVAVWTGVVWLAFLR